MPKLCLSLARWRRLLLRLYPYVSLQVHQILLELSRTPQLRAVRQIQQQREKLERKVLALQQSEQQIMAEATSSTSAPSGSLMMTRDEDRVRPLAMIQGRGKYLVPKLEPSPYCNHMVTKHGGNRHMTWIRCEECRQEQKMPLTPLDQLTTWNERLVFVKSSFYDDEKEKVKSEDKKKKSPYKLVPYPTRVSHKRVPQECPTECPTRVSHKSFLQE